MFVFSSQFTIWEENNKKERTCELVKVLAWVGSGVHIFEDRSCCVTTLCGLANILVKSACGIESETYEERRKMCEKTNALPV